jgi:PAS domain S-box-containing protein
MNGRLLKAIVDGLPFAVMAIDSSDNIVLWNKASENVFGWRSSEVIGKPVPIVPVDRLDEFRAFTEIARSGNPVQVLSRRQRKDGALVEVKVTVIPLHNGPGHLKCVMAMHEPIGGALFDMNRTEQQRREGPRPQTEHRRTSPRTEGLSRFTPRQRQIIRLTAHGQKNAAIAKRLSVSQQVIKNYLSGIYRELRIHSRTELLVWFNQQRQHE